ncbi:hypothetical protein HK405_005406 [Cladochytrium tenue]|nr:hypothetical protein HK405_005406 [Cladochytrium tenue]
MRTGSIPATVRRVLSADFRDMDESDTSVTSAIVEFAFQVDNGNLDDAFKMRVDVAITCLCNIRHAKAVAAVRKIDDEKNTDLKAAALAIFLGGPTAYLLEIGDKAGALAAFEKASALSTEIPQQVFESEYHMKSYAIESRDKSLKKWWAQYEETRGNFAEALRFYENSDDILSIVRLNCATGKLARAIDLAKGTDNPAAAYYIARQFEREGKISEAINFYGQAKCFTQAIRLAKEHNQPGQLVALALQGNRDSMLDAAEYIEMTGQNLSKAISLYHRAGHVARAVELCLKHGDFQTLEEITQGLGPDTDPTIVQRCSSFLLDNKQYDKAVSLLAATRRNEEALRICETQGISITDELADCIGGAEGESSADSRLLVRLGELCLQQKNYHLACKKFAQPAIHFPIKGGERIRAMKALLKSGDTEKIIFFATLKEARKCLSKAKETPQLHERERVLDVRVRHIEAFLVAKATAQTNAQETARLCEELLEDPDIDDAETLRALGYVDPRERRRQQEDDVAEDIHADDD